MSSLSSFSSTISTSLFEFSSTPTSTLFVSTSTVSLSSSEMSSSTTTTIASNASSSSSSSSSTPSSSSTSSLLSTSSSSTTTISISTFTSSSTDSSASTTSSSTSTSDTSRTSDNRPTGTSDTRRLSTTTFGSPVFITTTDSRGQTTTSAPAQFTTVLTITGDGGATTVTAIGVNPTLSSDNASKGSSFFHNTGAVAGVFLLVGLAAASILLFIFFYVRRRRRTQRLEHDSAVSATLAAAGFRRTPLDDDDGVANNNPVRYSSPDVEMNQRSTMGSIPSGGRASAFLDHNHQVDVGATGFDPYAEFPNPVLTQEGYSPVRASSPVDQVINHSASHSAGSYEPLLASFYRNDADSSTPPVPPPRNPKRLSDRNEQSLPTSEHTPPLPSLHASPRTAASSVYSSESTDDRLDPNLRQRFNDETEQREPRDEEDYSRPVLGVRNIPDGVSLASRES